MIRSGRASFVQQTVEPHSGQKEKSKVRSASEPRVKLLASPPTLTCSRLKNEFTENALPLRF
jgi:hypothetical protein